MWIIVGSLCFDVNYIQLCGGRLKNKYKKWMHLLLIKKSQYKIQAVAVQAQLKCVYFISGCW